MVKKILIVDDEPDVTDAVKLALEQLDPNYQVTCVNSGEQCLEVLQKNQIPDLILLDIMMPEMSGWDTFNSLKENPLWKKIPIVFLTAVPKREIPTHTDMFGEDYIEKPIEIMDLKKRIDQVFEKISLENHDESDT